MKQFCKYMQVNYLPLNTGYIRHHLFRAEVFTWLVINSFTINPGSVVFVDLSGESFLVHQFRVGHNSFSST